MKYLSIGSVFALLWLLSAAAQAVDCTQDSRAQLAKNNMSAASDGMMCGNAAQFYAYLCECRNNPRTDAQAGRLESTLRSIKSNYNNYGAFCRGIGPINDSIPSCMAGKPAAGGNAGGSAGGGASGGSDWGSASGFQGIFDNGGGSGGSSSVGGAPSAPLTNSDNGRVFNGEVMSLMNSLAADSENPRFSGLVEQMNQNAEQFQELRDVMGMFGPLSQSDYDTINMVENLAQGISIGVALFSKPPKPALSPEQKMAREKMGELSRGLRTIYNEVAAVPTSFEHNEEALRRLDKVEAEIRQYERATAKARLLYWEYVEFDGDPTWAEMEARQAELDRLEAQGGVEALVARIAEIQANYKTGDIPHIANADKGFAGVLDRIYLERARCYEALGKPVLAQEMRSRVSYRVPVGEAVKLIQLAWDEKDYYSVSKYHHIISERFNYDTPIRLQYTDAGSLDFDVDLLTRSEVNYLLALGVLANLRVGQISAAHNAMEDLEAYQAATDLAYQHQQDRSARSKGLGASDEEWRRETEKGRSITQTAKALLYSKTDQGEKALQAIEEAIALEKNAPSDLDNQRRFQHWMQFTRAEILANAGKLDEARQLLRDIKRDFVRRESSKAVSMADVDYLNAYIRYQQQDHKGALMAVRIMERKHEPQGRFFGLQERIHRALGDEEQAAVSRRNYEKLMSEDA